MSLEARSKPGPESDEGALALFGFEDEGWVGLLREAARPGDLGSVAGYRVLEEVGRGGQGLVFRAREESSGRIVALKRLAAGSLAGAEARARFQREIEAEASLRHPHIVGFQGVELVEGLPLLVMEWIDGLPADRWARGAEGRARPVREVLAAFARVCDAVSYAHQRGVIHRDLKPSNILIDSAGEPHVLDFGLARWRPGTEGVGPEMSRLTRTEGFVGTPAYAAPEQLTPGSDGADVRADVYALGVVLYEMLTGQRPFEGGGGDWERLVHAIRHEAPPPPSRRDRRVDGEVDAIVLRAIAKEPARRYQSAHELGADVRRSLAGEPVEARRDSAWYVARKFLRRHRVVVAAAALVVLSLAAGMAGTTFGLLRAEQRGAQAEAAQWREREQRELAEKREKETRQVSDFQAAMLSDIDVEAMARGIKERFREQVKAALERQYVGEGADRRPRTPEEVEAELAAFDQRAGAAQAVDVARRVMDEFVLARAADALEKEFGDQPLLRADLHFAVGRSYGSLGLYEPARVHLTAALNLRRNTLGPGAHLDVAAAMFNLAHVMFDLGDSVEAERLYREALAMWRELGDKEHIALALHALTDPLGRQRRWAEAERLTDEALRINRDLFDEDHPKIYGNLANKAMALSALGRHGEAEVLERRVLRWRREHYGDHHQEVAHILYNLAHTVGSQQRPDEAVQLYREALEIHRAVYGDEHPRVAKNMYQVGRALIASGRRREGEELYRQVLAQQRALLGDDHPDVRVTLRELANSRHADGDFDEGVTLLREALAITQRLYPDEHKEAFRRYSTMNMLGGALSGQAKALLDTDRAGALALMDEAESLAWAGCVGMSGMPLENL